eukprot:TRINITY_DN36713_c0_g1_i5.p1 TRINITY_DN36713_c0_g1~~TRINITY_DN36713_c0_g1_i5.p1  ORF type:complete len:425 (-),score=145.36 TRINITY_DN36713_c0_g1_i5:480-1754(-)
MIRRPPRSTLSSSSAASDVYKRQVSTQSTGADCAGMEVRKCDNCEEREVAWSCPRCEEAYCVWCDSTLHKSPAIRNHERIAVEVAANSEDDGSIKSKIIQRIRKAHEQLATKKKQPRRRAEDRFINLSAGVAFDHVANAEEPQEVQLRYSGCGEPESEEWARIAQSLTVPEDCKSVMCTDFEATDELNQCSLGVLEGLICQMIEGVAAEADFFISFETMLIDAQGPTATFRLALYFSTNFHDKFVTDNIWIKHVGELSALVALERPLVSVVDAADDYRLFDLMGHVKGQIRAALSCFQADSIASMPPVVKQWAEGIDSKLDKAIDLLPISKADLAMDIELDAEALVEIMEQELQMANMAALRELLHKVPVKMPGEFSTMLRGLKSVHVSSSPEAYAKLWTNMPLPVFQFLPRTDDQEEDEDSDW